METVTCCSTIQNNKRIDSLQALRAIAYTAIFVSHAYTCNGFPGAWGVSVFLVLSGFVLTYANWNKDIRGTLKEGVSFSKKAIGQLYPLHLLMLALVIITNIRLFVSDNLNGIAELLIRSACDILMIQSWVPFSNIWNAVNGVSWYLSVLLLISVLFPIIIVRVKKLNNIKKIIFALPCCYAVQIILTAILGNIPVSLNGYQKWVTYRLPAIRLIDFVIGCVAGRLFLFLQQEEKPDRKYVYTILELLAVALNILSLCIYPLSRRADALWYDRTVIFSPAVCFLVLIMALNKGAVSKVITNKVTTFIGNQSKYTFLVHQVVLLYFALGLKSLGWQWNNHIIAILSYVITLVFAFIWDKAVRSVRQRKLSIESKSNVIHSGKAE